MRVILLKPRFQVSPQLSAIERISCTSVSQLVFTILVPSFCLTAVQERYGLNLDVSTKVHLFDRHYSACR
jgi:hypothetical protein